MLQVLLFFLVTSTSAFTTHRYDAYDSFGNYRPNAPLLDNIFGLQNSNGRRPVQTYEYIKRYDGVVISDVYEEPVVTGDGDHRRVDMPYSYGYPYQWNRQVPWNRVVVTEPAKLYNRFENSSDDGEFVYNPNSGNRQSVVQEDEQEENNQRKLTNELKTQGNVSVPIKQSDDVNHTFVINEQQITGYNDHQGSSEDHANITTRSISSNSDNTNSLNVSKQNADKFNRPTKTNDDTAIKNNRNRPINANDSKKYSTKTTQDNEVTLRPHEQRTKAYDDDRWVWSDGQDQVVETTTMVGVVDRAAFSGQECPEGKQKLGHTCVTKD